MLILIILRTALELLVSNSVTGMPVLDDDGCVVGVVSDYDLLSLEGIAEQVQLLLEYSHSTGHTPIYIPN